MKIIFSRQFHALLSGLTIAFVISSCGWLADKPVSIASHVWPGYEPMFLARGEGWLNTNQVRLAETASASDSMQALAEGKVDGAALTLDEVLTARSRGIPLSVVMIFDVSAGADMLIARSGIKKLADLKDHRIGVEEGAVGGLMLANILRTAGLGKEDVKVIPLTIDKQANAWSQQQLDAVITYEPVAGILLQQGGIKLFDSRQIPNTIVDVLAIRGDSLDHSHTNSIRHLLSAYFKALDHLNRNPHDAAYRMASHLNLPSDRVLPAFKGLLLPDAANNYHMMTGSRPELMDTAHKVSAIMLESGLLQRDDTFKELIRPEFLPYATGLN
jgi:NitT/TauT family transport system substrate-binding protein